MAVRHLPEALGEVSMQAAAFWDGLPPPPRRQGTPRGERKREIKGRRGREGEREREQEREREREWERERRNLNKNIPDSFIYFTFRAERGRAEQSSSAQSRAAKRREKNREQRAESREQRAQSPEPRAQSLCALERPRAQGAARSSRWPHADLR